MATGLQLSELAGDSPTIYLLQNNEIFAKPERIFLSSLVASSFFLHTVIKIWILYLVHISLVALGPFVMHGAFSLWTSPASWAVASAVTQGPVLRSAPHLL